MSSTPQKTEVKKKKTVRFSNIDTTIGSDTKKQEIIAVPCSAVRAKPSTPPTSPTSNPTPPISEHRANIAELLRRIRLRRQSSVADLLPRMKEARTDAEKLRIIDAILAEPALVEHVDEVLAAKQEGFVSECGLSRIKCHRSR
uniref:Uncharacterized protein n=1 Tax=Steinernema glaseri TaxID=37863 RepID=A0A1I8AT16_9BILA